MCFLIEKVGCNQRYDCYIDYLVRLLNFSLTNFVIAEMRYSNI